MTEFPGTGKYNTKIFETRSEKRIDMRFRDRRTSSGDCGRMLALFVFLCLLSGCNQQQSDQKPVSEIMSQYLYEIADKKQKSSEIDLFGKTVLGLYKSSDNQTEKENMVLYHLSIPLGKMGFTMKYWDIDRGIPDQLVMKDVRAIATWFGSPGLQYPLDYLDFLDSAVNSGRKLIVFDNFGAWETRAVSGNTDVDTARVNLTLAKLGIWYLGDWTDDASLLKVAEKDPEMMETQAKIDLEEASFYYRFLKVDETLDSYLSIARKDRDYTPSPVVVTNRNGGYALSNYIYRTVDGKTAFLMNIEKFLSNALFPETREERIGLLADVNSRATKKILLYVEEILEKAKIPFNVIRKDIFGSLVPGDLRKFSSVGLILRADDGLDPLVIKDYLDGGGSVVSFYGGSFGTLAPLLGSSVVDIKGVLEKIGYRINPGFALTEGIGPASSSYKWVTGSLLPDKDAIVLGTASADDYPLFWTAARGAGKVLVWNWDGFAEAELAGLLLESFLYANPIVACGTIGVGHMFLDDWPLPMYNIVKPPLSITDTAFYTKTWWPDVEGILASHGIPYSAYLVFNYNDKVVPPFTGGEFYVGENMASLSIAEDLLARGTDLEFHGYNHMSLSIEKTQVNTNAWPSISAMEGSLSEGKRTWIGLFGRETLPFAYVAVNNIISQDGIVALHNTFPSIKVVSALKWGIEEETYTEIGPHPAIPGIYYIPRISYGYQSSQNVLNLVVSGASSFGLVSHFIHPDDVFDPNRSDGKSWETLRKEFGDTLEFIRTNYPWIEWKTIKDTYRDLVMYDDVDYSFEFEGDTLVVRTEPGALIRIRTEDMTLRKVTGADIVYDYKNMPVLIARAKMHECRFEF